MIRAAAIILALGACTAGESVSDSINKDAIWNLNFIGSQAFNAQGTISFPAVGQVVGKAPCNRYAASQIMQYPNFKLGPIMSTKRACSNLMAEGKMLQSLSKMTTIKVSEDRLILSDDKGFQMLFTQSRP